MSRTIDNRVKAFQIPGGRFARVTGCLWLSLIWLALGASAAEVEPQAPAAKPAAAEPVAPPKEAPAKPLPQAEAPLAKTEAAKAPEPKGGATVKLNHPEPITSGESSTNEPDPDAAISVLVRTNHTTFGNAPTALSNSFVTPSEPKPVAAKPNRRLEELKHWLDYALELRRSHHDANAETNFVQLLQTPDAPEEVKRVALMEVAFIAQEKKETARAIQILSQFVKRYPEDPSVPEILLRQGLLYREMGANTMALSKFYAVMSTALKLKLDRMDYYKQLVLHAQSEIANTYYLQGNYADSADFFHRLTRLDDPQLNQVAIQYKLIRSLAYLNRSAEAVGQAQSFLAKHPKADEEPEVRFLLAESLKKQGRNRESMLETLVLLKSQQAKAASNPDSWSYWRQRTGNDIANQLYKEGDYINALEVYHGLLGLDSSPVWQIPVMYQIALVYERLQQPTRASDTFGKILDHQADFGTNAPSPSISEVLEMARWRKNYLKWQVDMEAAARDLTLSNLHSPTNVAATRPAKAVGAVTNAPAAATSTNAAVTPKEPAKGL